MASIIMPAAPAAPASPVASQRTGVLRIYEESMVIVADTYAANDDSRVEHAVPAELLPFVRKLARLILVDLERHPIVERSV